MGVDDSSTGGAIHRSDSILISEIISYFIGIGLLGVVWYYLDAIVIHYINDMVVKYPTYYAPASVTFTKAAIHWFLLLALIGVSFSLFVVAQRSKQPRGFY